MSYNDGAVIVPTSVASAVFDQAAERPNDSDYARVQLLTESAYQKLVFDHHDRTYIVYGELSKDFPLCMDFANICAADVLRGAVKAGLAVRPCFGVLVYTKKAGVRHAINYAVTSDKRVLYFEPQTDIWIDEPEDFKTADEFRL